MRNTDAFSGNDDHILHSLPSSFIQIINSSFSISFFVVKGQIASTRNLNVMRDSRNTKDREHTEGKPYVNLLPDGSPYYRSTKNASNHKPPSFVASYRERERERETERDN